ncbi:hypothetical protein VTN02DRAFT_3234 [Thermoascus thermophilus]
MPALALQEPHQDPLLPSAPISISIAHLHPSTHDASPVGWIASRSPRALPPPLTRACHSRNPPSALNLGSLSAAPGSPVTVRDGRFDVTVCRFRPDCRH